MRECNELNPLVSIIIPAYNAEKYIGFAVDSVLDQTYQKFEILIIDDGSQDNTRKIMEEYSKKDDRIRLLYNEHNLGVAATRNKGIELAKGFYICFLDSDDMWVSTKIEEQIQVLEDMNADFVYTSYRMIDDNGNECYESFKVPKYVNFKDLLKFNVIGCSTVMIKKEIVNKYNFDDKFYHEDYVLWLNLLKLGYKANGIKKPLVKYRVYKTSKAGNKFNSAKKRFKIYREYLHLSLLKSVWYSMRYAIYGLKKYKKVGV